MQCYSTGASTEIKKIVSNRRKKGDYVRESSVQKREKVTKIILYR